jgi:hypothetical protein
MRHGMNNEVILVEYTLYLITDQSLVLGKNPYGNLLLNLCRGNDLFIVNGRIGDNKVGNLTCRNASVFISSGLILLSFSERSLQLLTFMLSMSSRAFNGFQLLIFCKFLKL